MKPKYEMVVVEGDRLMDYQELELPFIRLELRVGGFRKALKVLLGTYKLNIMVSADEDTFDRVKAMGEEHG